MFTQLNPLLHSINNKIRNRKLDLTSGTVCPFADFIHWFVSGYMVFTGNTKQVSDSIYPNQTKNTKGEIKRDTPVFLSDLLMSCLHNRRVTQSISPEFGATSN